jgi:hypothetical protein
MALEKKIVKIDGFIQKKDNAEEIKKNIESALRQQKEVKQLIYLFVAGLFLIALMYIFS